VSDADHSVLYDQLAAREPLDSHELERAIRVEPERPLDATRLAALLSIPIGDGAPVR
jgi:hypothetical protein